MNEAMIEMHHVYKDLSQSDLRSLRYHFGNFPRGIHIYRRSQWCGRALFFAFYSVQKKPTSGKVLVHGMHITQPGFKKIYQLRRKMGIVSQDFKLLKDRTVNENVAFALEVTGHPSKGGEK